MNGPYRIEVAPAARRALRKLARSAPVEAARIAKTISALATDPRTHGAKPLTAQDGRMRVRTGDYRIIYTIDDGVLIVLVLAIGHRSHIYDRGR